MEDETYAGIRDLVKEAIPLVSRVGAVLGGLVSLLAAIEKVSGELTMALAGFMLVAAISSSAVVVWGRTTRAIGRSTSSVPLFSQANRRTGAIVMAVSTVLLIFFLVQVVLASSRPPGQGRFALNPSSGLGRAARLTPPAGAPPPGTPGGAAPATATTPTPTAAPSQPPPVISVASLIGQGFDALAAGDFRAAQSLFERALESDATSAPGQLGLGEAAYQMGNYRAAIPPLRLATQLDPSLHDAHAYLGFAYEDTQDVVRARAEFEEFLRVAAADAPLRSQVLARLRRTGPQAASPSPAPRGTSVPGQTLGAN